MTRVTRWLLVAGAGLCFLTSEPAQAAVPALRDVPPGITPAVREALVKEHDRLVKVRDDIRDDLVPHNQRCSAVEAGTPAAAACLEAQKGLQQRVKDYGEAVERFHRMLDKAAGGPGPRGTEWPVLVEARGDVAIFGPDGHKESATNIGMTFLAYGDRIATGLDGHIRLVLPDGTAFTIGPNSDLLVDKFVFDTDANIWVTLAKGAFRWVTGTTGHRDPGKMKVTLPLGDLGIRGTDFEVTLDPSGNGKVRLATGELEFTEKKTGRSFRLAAGQALTFTSNGIIGDPSAGPMSSGEANPPLTLQVRPVCQRGETSGTRLPRATGGEPVCVTDTVLLDAAQIFKAEAEPNTVGTGYTVVIYWTEAGKTAFTAAIGPYRGKQVALVGKDGVAVIATVAGQIALLQPTPPGTILAVVGGPVLEFAPMNEFLARALADTITGAVPMQPGARRPVSVKGAP